MKQPLENGKFQRVRIHHGRRGSVCAYGQHVRIGASVDQSCRRNLVIERSGGGRLDRDKEGIMLHSGAVGAAGAIGQACRVGAGKGRQALYGACVMPIVRIKLLHLEPGGKQHAGSMPLFATVHIVDISRCRHRSQDSHDGADHQQFCQSEPFLAAHMEISPFSVQSIFVLTMAE